MNSKGQSLVEGIMALLTLVICCQSFIWLFVLIENSMVIHHLLYEAMVCTQLQPLRPDCSSSTRQQIARQIWGSELIQIDLQQSETQVTGWVQIRPPWGRLWTLTDSLALPLREPQ